VFSHVKLSGKPFYDRDNIVPFIFFVPLIVIGYLSVVASVYMLVMGVSVIGNRPDIQPSF
jgi:hypothetical protein